MFRFSPRTREIKQKKTKTLSSRETFCLFQPCRSFACGLRLLLKCFSYFTYCVTVEIKHFRRLDQGFVLLFRFNYADAIKGRGFRGHYMCAFERKRHITHGFKVWIDAQEYELL